MLPSLQSRGAGTLQSSILFRLAYIFLVLSFVSGKVDNSFQSNQYPQYNSYYGSTPGYQTPDLTVKSGADISNSPVIGEVQSQDPLLSQSSAQQPVANSPNQHVFYYETYPMKDTSRGNSYGYPIPRGNKRCFMGNGGVKCHSRQDYGSSSSSSGWGWSSGYDYDEGDDSGGGLGGLAGLVGLLGLKGLKGVATVLLPILLLPILLPLLLPLLLLPFIPLFLLLPVPVVSVPANAGRNLQVEFMEARKLVTGAVERVITSDECIERITCEISKMSQKRKAGEWLEKALNYLPESSPITKRIFKGYEMVSNTTTVEKEGRALHLPSCGALKCKMLSLFDSPKG